MDKSVRRGGRKAVDECGMSQILFFCSSLHAGFLLFFAISIQLSLSLFLSHSLFSFFGSLPIYLSLNLSIVLSLYLSLIPSHSFISIILSRTLSKLLKDPVLVLEHKVYLCVHVFVLSSSSLSTCS